MKVILILGAAVWADGPSPTLVRRTARAFKVWQQDRTQIIIPCGGLGKHPPSEAAAMAKLLADHGVPDHLIRCEDRSKSTFENIQNAAQLLAGTPITALTIVTDSYHIPRAWMVARYFGLKPRMVATSLRGTHAPTQLRQHLREAGALPR